MHALLKQLNDFRLKIRCTGRKYEKPTKMPKTTVSGTVFVSVHHGKSLERNSTCTLHNQESIPRNRFCQPM
jgi:hypothetical protein